jgi:hypothetical protein
MKTHDPSYKLLFSHPQMVRDLLVGFIAEPWVAELDFATLEQVSGSYVADDLRDREDDLLWRVRFRDRWLYLYLVLEFQARVDPFMAVRQLNYIGLLYQDLIRQGVTAATGRLPPVLPIVLYNGKPRWTAATELFDLIEPAPGRLAVYAPRLRYLLLDEGAIDESAPWALQNLVAALFRLEKSQGPGPLHEALSALIQWLGAAEQAGLRPSRPTKVLRETSKLVRYQCVKIDLAAEKASQGQSLRNALAFHGFLLLRLRTATPFPDGLGCAAPSPSGSNVSCYPRACRASACPASATYWRSTPCWPKV